MKLAAQYYRPPTPWPRNWDRDLDAIKDAGLDAIQLWAVWGWIEAQPDQYNFDDYDALVEKCARRGLGVIISTIAEVQPFWMPRLYPHAAMIGHDGKPVISTPRCECNGGLTPGQCTDDPDVRERATRFLKAIGAHYRTADNLIGWDAWNETRWTVYSDAFVCYCPRTLAGFRAWLEKKYGGLEGLNQAWQRRYADWADVFPTKQPQRTYADLMDFSHYLIWRANETARWRYAAIRKGDPNRRHLISAHHGNPSASGTGGGFEQAFVRGNEWDLADELDGFGCSFFPLWRSQDEKEYAIGVEILRSACGDKPAWIGELQGGQANIGFGYSPPLDAQTQQRWIWSGFARGVKTIIFWCWRDESWGCEAPGFGITGCDGHAERRIEAFRVASRLIKAHEAELDAYQPDPGKVGVLFAPDNYILAWTAENSSKRAADSLQGYGLALERLHVPYTLLEANHLARLKDMRLVIAPWPLTVSDDMVKALLTFADEGGHVLFEGAAQSFSDVGFYRTSEERLLLQTLGLREACRKAGNSTVMIAAQDTDNQAPLALPVQDRLWPLTLTRGEALGKDPDGETALARIPYGRGWIYYLSSFAAKGYFERQNQEFEKWLKGLIAGASADASVRLESDAGTDQLIWRSGQSGGRHLLFVMNSGGTVLVRVCANCPLVADSRAATCWNDNIKIPWQDGGTEKYFSVTIPAGEYRVFAL